MKKIVASLIISTLIFSAAGTSLAGAVGDLGSEYNAYIDSLSIEKQEQEALAAAYTSDGSGYYKTDFYVGYSSGTGIIGPEGRFVYEQEEGEYIDICANGFIITETDDDYFLKTADGEVVFSAKSLGATGFGMIAESSSNEEFLRDGYVFVYCFEESISEDSYKAGIISTDGNWIIEMSEDLPLLTAISNVTSDVLERGLYYADEGCIIVNSKLRTREYKYDNLLYSIATNTCNEFELVEGEASKMSVSSESSAIRFSNGVAISTFDKAMFMFYPDGNVKQFNYIGEDINPSSVFGYNLMQDESVRTLVKTMESVCEIIGSDAVIKELDLNIVDGFAIDGGWMITETDDEGSHYYTAIDIDGNYIFEPVETGAVFIVMKDGRSLRFDDGSGQPDGHKLVLDYDGSIIYEGYDDADNIEVNNDIIFDYISSSWGADEGTYIDIR